MQQAQNYECPELEDQKRDTSVDPRKPGLVRAFEQIDVVDCLLHRRRFRADFAHDNLLAINLFSDKSPNSGDELQGMVMVVWRKQGAPMNVIMTGATLNYGHTDVISITVCLLHAMWLMAGPEYPILSYVLSKVISTTTDSGGEMSTLTMLDCAEAYCAWMSGTDILRCRTLVNKDQRWLPNALRVAGWSHVMGNAMKAIAESCADWPRYLKMLRAELLAQCYLAQVGEEGSQEERQHRPWGFACSRSFHRHDCKVAV